MDEQAKSAMSLWKKLFGVAKKSRPKSSETWEIICPICHTKYHLGVDSFITTEDDTRAMLAGARGVVGNVNKMIIREDLIRKNGDDLTVARQAALNEETKQKIRKIKEDLKNGIDRKWFCRKCGGPEKGTNPYKPSVHGYPNHAQEISYSWATVGRRSLGRKFRQAPSRELENPACDEWD
jgi:hypothetical protein